MLKAVYLIRRPKSGLCGMKSSILSISPMMLNTMDIPKVRIKSAFRNSFMYILCIISIYFLFNLSNIKSANAPKIKNDIHAPIA